jgi:hypothetical protein
MTGKKKEKRMSFYIHPYITNGYNKLPISSSLLSILLLFIFCKKKSMWKKRKKEKMPIHSFIIEFRCCKLLLFTLLPFVPFLYHDVYSISSVLSFSLVFSFLNYYYTLCTHNNIYILHTHTQIFHLLILQHAWLCIRSSVFFSLKFFFDYK